VANTSCDLCLHDGGELILRNDKLRVVRVADDAFPAYYRVIWNEHVAELSESSFRSMRSGASKQSLRWKE
jgi:diadenosine tetraphosphate (Ap4A) HIT family hydrolase